MENQHQKAIELLGQSPLFAHLMHGELDRLAALFQPVYFHADEVIFSSGASSEALYLVYEGKVELVSEDDFHLSTLMIGDIFGEEAFLFDDPRFYNAIARSEITLLQFSVDHYYIISEHLSGIEDKLEVLINSRKLSTHVELPWLQRDEHVHVITRRHPAILWGKLILPILLGLTALIGSGLLQTIWMPERSFGWLLLAIEFPFSIFWLIWRIYDWRNDYFIVTNKRVVWIEKIALIYESRQEAPLRTIMSVGLHRSQLGRIFDFADVVVMTYVGTIRLQNLKYAEAIERLIESYWHRSESFDRLDEAQAMAEKLDEKLELPWDDTREAPAISQDDEGQDRITEDLDGEEQDSRFFPWLFSDFIRLRFETGGAVVYRKHWFILIKKIWLPLILSFISFGALASRIGGLFTFLELSTAIIILFSIMLVCVFWMIYQYADWRNDVFKITLDQIIDIDRKPLGRIRHRSAPLENILSIEYKRQGFWGFLFNFGTVFITVGNMKLSFDHVYDPSEVQQDVFYRMGERLEKIRKFEIASERERFSDWIAGYHERAERYRKMLEEKTHFEFDDQNPSV